MKQKLMNLLYIHFDAKYKSQFYQTVHPNLDELELEDTLNKEEKKEKERIKYRFT